MIFLKTFSTANTIRYLAVGIFAISASFSHSDENSTERGIKNSAENGDTSPVVVENKANESIPAVPVSHETTEQPINEIVVNVTRSQLSTFESPFTITTIDSQTFEHKMVRSLPEVLVDVPGVMVQKTANGQGSPFIRGFTGYRTLALIDGIRYNNSVYRDGPNEYFSLIDFHGLEQLELLNGPASAAYGSDAIGGTLNLQTKSSAFTRKTENQYFFDGSQQARFSSAEHSQQLRTELDVGLGGQWGLHLGVTKKYFGQVDAAKLGKLSTTDYDESGLDARLDIRLNKQWTLTAAHQQLSQDDVWRTHSTVFSKSFSGSSIGSDQLRLKDQARSLSYIKLNTVEFTGWVDEATVTFSRQQWDESGDHTKNNGKRIDDYFDSRMTGFELQLQSDFDIGLFTYGMDAYRDKVETGRTDFNADNTVDEVRIQGPVGDNSSYDQLGFYAQGEFSLSNQISLLLGSRYTYVRAHVGKYQDPQTGLSASYTDHWDAVVNSLRLSFQPDIQADLNLWSGISQSFRAPNIADVSRFGKSRSSETEVAATHLDPEYFLTYEIGAKVQNTQADLSISAYYTDIRDFITSTPTGRIIDGLTEVSKQNSSNGFVKGIEFIASYHLMDNLTATANATWLKGNLEVYPEAGVNQSITEPMSRIMPFTTHLGLDWVSPHHDYWVSFHLTHANKANRLSSADIQDNERIPPGGTPAYTLLGLNAGWVINEQLELTAGVSNLLDEAYRSHGSGSNEPGRSLNMGIKINF